MTTADILSFLDLSDLPASLAALEDGHALASLGVTDSDQCAVEEAHATIAAMLAA